MSPSPAATTAGANDSTQKLATTTPTTTAGSAIEFEPPLACVRRILKNTLPNSTNVGKDASAAFCRACGIFVIYLTACANDFARENKRQTITANDVLAAVKELDFDDFTPQLKVFLDGYRTAEKSKRDAKARAKEEGAAATADQQQPDAKRQKTTDKEESPEKESPEKESPEKDSPEKESEKGAEEDSSMTNEG